MIIRNLVVDRTALPAEMLPLAKTHMRVEHSTDDAYIQGAIARAIGALEQCNDVLINPSSYDWAPVLADFANGRARIPYSPVNSFTADAGGDVSVNYAIETGAIHGAKPQYLAGAHVEGLELALVAGYAALADVPPRMQDRILRLAAHLYEHREILSPDQPFTMPDLLLDTTDWMPRV